jgi:hypothetical protein
MIRKIRENDALEANIKIKEVHFMSQKPLKSISSELSIYLKKT